MSAFLPVDPSSVDAVRNVAVLVELPDADNVRLVGYLVSLRIGADFRPDFEHREGDAPSTLAAHRLACGRKPRRGWQCKPDDRTLPALRLTTSGRWRIAGVVCTEACALCTKGSRVVLTLTILRDPYHGRAHDPRPFDFVVSVRLLRFRTSEMLGTLRGATR